MCSRDFGRVQSSGYDTAGAFVVQLQRSASCALGTYRVDRVVVTSLGLRSGDINGSRPGAIVTVL